MKILFVYSLYDIASPKKPLRDFELVQFGLSYISSFLKLHGHTTKLMVLSRTSGNEINHRLIEEIIGGYAPDLVAFSAISTEYNFIVKIANFIRRTYPKKLLLIGGAHVSLNPEGVLDHFDALCLGEGEYPMLDLLTQLEQGQGPTRISNLWLKQKNGEIEKNPTRPFLQNLDVLPFPDRTIWSEWIDEKPGARFSILLGRGCPFECTYCSNHALKKIASGTYTRYRSPENIINEIKQLYRERPDIKELYLEVENVGTDLAWLTSLGSQLEQFNKTITMPLTFGTNLRITPNLKIETIFSAFRKANFRFVNIGLESGSERIRSQILNRHYKNEDIIKAVDVARHYGLKVAFYNMIGLPGETEEDFKETIKMNRRCLPDWASCSIFYPYPGTRLYSLCESNGLLEETSGDDRERDKAALNLPGFSKKAVERNRLWFEYSIYMGHVAWHRLLWKVFRATITSNAFLFSFYRKIKNMVLHQKERIKVA